MKKLLLAGLIVLGVTAYAANPTTSADDTASVEIEATGEVIAALKVTTGEDPDNPYDPGDPDDPNNPYPFNHNAVRGEDLKFGTMVQGETRDTTDPNRTDVECVMVNFFGQPDYLVNYYFSEIAGDNTPLTKITLTLGGGSPTLDAAADSANRMEATLYLNDLDNGLNATGEQIQLSPIGKKGVLLIGEIFGETDPSGSSAGNASNQNVGKYETDLYVNAIYDQVPYPPVTTP